MLACAPMIEKYQAMRKGAVSDSHNRLSVACY